MLKRTLLASAAALALLAATAPAQAVSIMYAEWLASSLTELFAPDLMSARLAAFRPIGLVDAEQCSSAGLKMSLRMPIVDS